MTADAFVPIRLRNVELKNRFIKTATYEGMSRDGIPDERLFRFHAEMAANDVALTTVAYGAVSEDGLTHEDQMVVDERAVPHLRRLSSAVRENGGKISLQLTHCGYFTRSTRYHHRRPLAPSRVFNKYGVMKGRPFSRAMGPEDIRRTVQDFSRAAAIAIEAGFDAVEIHAGHGYLLSQFLSPAINRRQDEYGGSLTNRLRFPLEVIDGVRKAVGEDIPVLVKLNLEDGFSGGFTLKDCIASVSILEEHGVDAVLLSGGYTSRTPFYLMRGEVPLKELVASERNYLQKLAMVLFGRRIIKKYIFNPNFFLQMALQVRRSTGMPLVYVGGVISGEGVAEIMEAGFDMIAIGRALIAEPDFLLKIKKDPRHLSPCDQGNKCVGFMEKTGVKCHLPS